MIIFCMGVSMATCQLEDQRNANVGSRLGLAGESSFFFLGIFLEFSRYWINSLFINKKIYILGVHQMK